MGLFNIFRKKENFEKEKTTHLPVMNGEEAVFVNESFSYFGNGKCGRPLDELDTIKLEEADKAFKKYKKEILDVFMKENGFIKYKTNAYMRLNEIGLIEYVNLQKEAHGSRTFTLNICLLPIYVPHDVFTIGFGDRIGILINGKDFWWDFKDMGTAENSFKNIVQALKIFILPWFEKYTDENHYKEALLAHMGTIGISCIKWVIYLFIKNNENERAESYLNDYLNSEDYLKELEVRKKLTKEVILKLKSLLNSSNTNEEIISNAIKYNVEKYKFPPNFSFQNLTDGNKFD